MIRTLVREDPGPEASLAFMEEITINIGDISAMWHVRTKDGNFYVVQMRYGQNIQLESLEEYGLIREALEEFHQSRDEEEDYCEGDYENDDFLTPAGSLMNEYNDLGTDDILPYDSPGGLDDY